MDERSPRQPDSSGPPEESGDTPTRDVRPANPYRIPQRSPAPEGSEADGASGRPDTWDTPYPAAQGPTGEWSTLRADETPPTDTWKDWETPERSAEGAGSGWFSGEDRTGGAQDAEPAAQETPNRADDVWSRPAREPRDGGDAQPTEAPWGAGEPGGSPDATADASRSAGGSDDANRDTGDAYRGAHSGPRQGASAWDSTEASSTWGAGGQSGTWGEQSRGAHEGTDSGTAWNTGDQSTGGADDAPWSAHSEPQHSASAWDSTDDSPTWENSDRDAIRGDANSGARAGASAWGESSGDTSGTASWSDGGRGSSWSADDGARPSGVDDAPSWGTEDRGTAWGEQSPGAHEGTGSGAAWNTGAQNPGGTDDTPWSAHSGPQRSASTWDSTEDSPSWGTGGQSDTWGEQPHGAHEGTDSGTAWSTGEQDRPWGDTASGPQPSGTSWDEQPRTDDSWNTHSGPQTSSARSEGSDGEGRGTGDREDSWGGRTGETPHGPDTDGGSWAAGTGPRPVGADDSPSWGTGGQSDTWGEQPHGAHEGTGSGAAWNTGERDRPWGDTASGTSWGEQPPADDSWNTHGGPQATAGWGEQPGGTGDGWDAQPRGAHQGPGVDGDDRDPYGDDPHRQAEAWNASGGADGYGDDPRGDGRPGEPGYGDRWSGPQQGDGSGGDGRGGPPRDPGGTADGWDDWDGERPDGEHGGEAAPRGENFEYLYNGGDPAAQPPGEPERPRRKSRRGLVIGLVSAVVVLALVGGAASWYVLTLPQPEEATAEYEAAWEAQEYDRLAAVTTGGDPAEVIGGIADGIGVESFDVTVGEPVVDGGAGTASYEVAVGLSNAGDWGWEGELPLVRQDGEWLVDFSPEVAFPGLAEGESLARTAVWGERGRILAADGTRLDTPDISGSLQMLVGGMGEATEEDVERLGPAYRIGDNVGTSGLLSTYEARLAGQAATTILKVEAGTDVDSVEVTDENTVVSLDGAPGEDVVTSIDMGVQNAAANAIIDSSDPAGMVAIRPSTGEILAAVNVPGGFNRAFEGRYPPGSTFKVVSYNALLDGGMSLDSPFECPKEYNPGGWEFTNAGGAEYGSQTMTEAFATSCNTALVQAAVDNIDANTLLASAELFGMNAALSIGVPTFEPVYPLSEGAVMLGAQAIGQGQVETSPLHMATVPAAVADGNWRAPQLVTEPVAEDLPEPRPIPNAEALRTMMRAVITEGTAEDLPFQGEVYGKTGTAEFGTAEGEDEELPSHAWMVGFKGDVAFAVVVEGGGGGSSVAGPIAADFTNAL
ncbi:penicillin-binding transpeptidase domain-containing protein [Nocardiopsis flavescens]